MDELLVSWLGSDDVYENVLNLVEKYDEEGKATHPTLLSYENIKWNYNSSPTKTSETI